MNDKPTEKTISDLPVITKFIYSIGVLPTSYKMSMTYEEQVVWLCNYLETTVIPAVNQNGEAVEELQNLYELLRTYVNDYFDNLDVQDEIDNKINGLVEDGTFSNIINNELFTEINNRILQNSVDIGSLDEELGDTVKRTDSDIVGMNMLTQEVRTALTGGSTAVVGIDSVNSENIVNKAVDIYKLDDIVQANFTKEFENVELGNPVQGNYKYVSDGEIATNTNNVYEYYDIALENNTIYSFSGYNMYDVPSIIVYDSSDDSLITYTVVDNPTTNFDGKKLIFKTNKSGIKAYINKHLINQSTNAKYNSLITLTKLSEVTQNKKENYIEKIKDINNYLAIYSTSSNTYTLINNTSVPCRTEVYKLSSGTKYTINSSNIYTNCGVVILNEKLEPSYYSNTENAGNQPVPFVYEFTASDDGYALLQFITSSSYTVSSSIYINEDTNKYKNMKWTLLGDSLTDPNVNSSVKKYYSYVQDDLQITIQNLGQSGCGYKRKYENGNNFVEQSLLIDSNTDVITIFGSFNDHNIYDTDGLGNVSDTTTDTVFGCMNTTFSNIITRNPNAKVAVILPTPWNSPSCNPYNPRTRDIEYIEGLKTIAKKYSIPVLDLFYESSMFPWNSNFRTMFYVSGDGTHPNTEGNKRFAYQIEELIKRLV